jgi:hypothetical protein
MSYEGKEETELYYAQEKIDGELQLALQATRQEPGISIQSVANIIKRVFKAEEINQLIEFLK